MKKFESIQPSPTVNGRLVKTAVSPRPIAWISTVSENGVDNLAPFSSYNYISSSPPVLVFNTGIGDNDSLKDTARNAKDTGEFVVNVVTDDVVDSMIRTSDEVPSNISEFDHADVERLSSTIISPPRVADSKVSMECTVYDSMRVYDRMVILGEVVQFHVAEEVLSDGKIEMGKVGTIGRLGGPYYTKTEPIVFNDE